MHFFLFFILSSVLCAGQSDVFFQEDFESGTFAKWSKTSRLDNQTGNVRIIEGFVPGLGGSKIARFTAFAGASPAKVDLRYNFKPGYNEVYARWYVKYENDFDQGDLMHAPGLIAGSDNWRSDFLPNGHDAFSVFLDIWSDWGKNAPPGKLMLYTYYPDMERYPDGHYWGTFFPRQPQVQIFTDRWYCLEMMVKANTPGKKDGEQAFWVDGEKMGHWKGLRFRDTSSLKIDFFWWELYIHDNPKTNIAYVDNIVLSTAFIGPARPIPAKPEKQRTKIKVLENKNRTDK